MIVVDTNIIAYLYLPSDHSAQAEDALLRDPLWVAPLLWRSELQNVLALHIRRGLLSLAKAQQMMAEARLLMRGREYEMAPDAVLALAAASTCSAYDCEFVALAQDLNVPLITVDKQVLSQFPDVAVSLATFVGS
jgi:predicted nucleic acid-binding protein